MATSTPPPELPDLASLKQKYADLPPPDVRITTAQEHKTQGNASYQQKSYVAAAEAYQKAIDAIANEWEFTAFEARDAKELRVLCHSNLAQCLINVGNYYEARKSCDSALEIDDEHAKTLYRRGLAHMHLSAYEAAKKDLKCALALEPDNKIIRQQLDKLQKKVLKHKRKEQKVFKKAFENLNGVFSEHRDHDVPWLEKWMRRVEEKILTYGPWMASLLPLLLLSGKFFGLPASLQHLLKSLFFFGSNASSTTAVQLLSTVSQHTCAWLFFCMGFVQLRWSYKKRGANWLPSWLPYCEQISWIHGSVSMLVAWTMVMARTSSELSLASKVGIVAVVLSGGMGVLGEDGSRLSVSKKGVRATSVLMLLTLLTGHAT